MKRIGHSTLGFFGGYMSLEGPFEGGDNLYAKVLGRFILCTYIIIFCFHMLFVKT